MGKRYLKTVRGREVALIFHSTLEYIQSIVINLQNFCRIHKINFIFFHKIITEELQSLWTHRNEHIWGDRNASYSDLITKSCLHKPNYNTISHKEV
jgi:hypothetical protein